MNSSEIKEFHLIGLSLKGNTSNENGQSAIDCGSLWQKFEKGNYFEKIPGKLGNEIYAVYHNYEGDHTKPFSYFIGCKVKNDTEVPADLDKLIVPGGRYEKIIAKGKMPDCIAQSWKEIWNSGLERAYNTDFEVYDERSKDWNNAEADIFISLK
jgi:predicted transcriptional regulator YdeE